MTTFGDGIDWSAEARRAAKDMPPGEGVGEMHLNLREALKDVARPRLIDCGCNIARFAPPMVALGFDYTGIDQSAEAIEIAHKRYPTLHFGQTFLWDDWPRYFEPFDAALCNAVLQHNTHDEKRLILPRIAQALRSGGVFGMQESVVHEETATQLRQDQWVTLVEGFGFKLLKTWHRNELGLEDAFLFRREG